MKKLLVSLLLVATLLPGVAFAAFEGEVWHERLGTWLETIWPEGRDILINGVNKYLNFGFDSGISGYGIRDNGGIIECKNDGGAWAPCVGSGSGGGGSGNVATSSAETSGRVPFWTSTGATPATLSGGVAGFTFNSTDSRLTVTNASTTAFSSIYASSTSLVGGTLTVNTSITMGGDTLTDFVGDGLDVSGGALIFDCSDVAGTGITCSGEDITASLGTSIDLTTEVTGDLPFSNLAQVAANSVLGNITGGTADAASIATSSLFAGTNGQVLARVNGTWVGVATTTAGTGLTYTGTAFNVDLGTSITVGELASADFGSWTCNGAACTIDASSVTNAMLQNSTISGIALGSNLNSLTNDATLNGSSYNGSAAISDWGLNLANPNTWTALQNFSNATTSLLTVTGTATSTWLQGNADIFGMVGIGRTATTTVRGDNATSTFASGILATGLQITGHTNLGGNLTFNSVTGSTWAAFCTAITGGAGLCDGTDASGGGSSVVSTSSSETANFVPFWTSTNGTPALLSGGESAFQYDSTLDKLTVSNASTTNLSVATALFIVNELRSISDSASGGWNINLGGSVVMTIDDTGGTTIANQTISPLFQIDTNSTGVSLDTDGDGMLIVAGTGNGNDEDLRWNFDDAAGGANFVDITSGTGVTTVNYSSIALQESGSNVLSVLDLDTCSEFAALGSIETGACGSLVFSDSPVFADDFDLMATGVRFTGTDGTFSMLGLGNGQDEGLTFDFDNDQANFVRVSSATAVATTSWNMALESLTRIGIGGTSTTTLQGNGATSTFAGGVLGLSGAFTNLVSCDTIDTDSGGFLKCGTDAGGAGAGDPNEKWATSTVDSTAIYPNSAARIGIGTTTPQKLLHVYGNVSGGIARFERRTAVGVAGYYGTQDIALSNTGADVDLAGPSQTFSYVDSAGTVSALGSVAALRDTANDDGLINIIANDNGAFSQVLAIDGNQGVVAVGSSTPSGAANSCGTFGFCVVNAALGPSGNGNLSEAQIKLVSATSTDEVRSFFTARSNTGSTLTFRGEIGSETNHFFGFFSNNLLRGGIFKEGGFAFGLNYASLYSSQSLADGIVIIERQLGVGTSTPWATLSIASSTYNGGSLPLFAIATSTRSFFTVTATSTSMRNLVTGTRDAGVRVVVGDERHATTSRDHLFVDGRQSSSWLYNSCNTTPLVASLTADTANICGWMTFNEDTNATLTENQGVGGPAYSLSITAAIATDGAELLMGNQDDSFLTSFASTTPVMDVTAGINNITATGTSYYVGLVSLGYSGLSSNPTRGVFFTATSTTGNNWKVVCAVDSSNMTIIDTGIATTSGSAGQGYYPNLRRFRIEYHPDRVRFFIKATPYSTMSEFDCTNTAHIPTSASGQTMPWRVGLGRNDAPNSTQAADSAFVVQSVQFWQKRDYLLNW